MKPNILSPKNPLNVLRALIAVCLSVGLLVTAAAIMAAPGNAETNTAILPQEGSSLPTTLQSRAVDELAPDHVTISDAHPGFYIENGTSPLSPASKYHTDGSYRFWAWSQLQSGPDTFTFNTLDSWINQQLNAGYGVFGIAMYTYTSRYVSCDYPDAIFIPEFVQDGPDGIHGNADDPIIRASNNDTRNCDGDGNNDNDPWYLIDYDDPYYLEQYQLFVEALADYIANHPDGYRFKWIATGSGKDGETKAVDSKDIDDADLTSEQWIATVNQITDFYIQAFSDQPGNPGMQVLIQNAPFHKNSYERRDTGAHAASVGAGPSINQITADFDSTHSCANSNPDLNCTGMWDPTRLYSDTVPIAFESYSYMMGTENEFYWSMARALDAHADIIRLSSFWTDSDNDTPNFHTIAEWAAKYIGAGMQQGEDIPPSIWSRAREHRRPCFVHYTGSFDCNYYPPVGNAEFYLIQLHTVSGGTTTPVTDDDRITYMGWSGVSDKPWHYNETPVDATVQAVGLFNPSSEGGHVQLEVDPAYSIRRSDQAGGNYGFFYDADDRYISPDVALHGVNEVIVTITYLDTGNDHWRLKYDGVNGETAAELYALQNWDIGTGLAIDGGLPTAGVQDPRPSTVQKSNSGQWKTATFLIEDGYFGNRLPGGADFYIDSRSDTGANDGNEYIHHVNVERRDKMVVQNLSVSRSGDNLILSWDAAPGVIDHYEVWRSDSAYFDPGAGATLLDSVAAAGPLTYTDATSAINDPDINHSYLVLAVESDGHYSPYQPRVGEFGYGLVIP
jgi:hypothetical protein